MRGMIDINMGIHGEHKIKQNQKGAKRKKK